MRRERVALLILVLAAGVLGSLLLRREALLPAATPAPAPVPDRSALAAAAEREPTAPAPEEGATPAQGRSFSGRVAPKLRRPVGSGGIPPGPLASWIDAYRARAAGGDAAAALVLGIALPRCAPLPAPAAADALLLEAGMLKSARDDEARAQVAAAQAAARREQLAYCADLEPPSRAEAYAMIELAAQLGSEEGMFHYLNRPPQFALEWPRGELTESQREQYALFAQQQFEIAREAQAQGSSVAIRWLASRARQGYAADGRPDDAARDSVAAYAGYMAIQLLNTAVQRGYDREAADAIAELERELRPEQLDAAMARAFELVGGSECCVVY